MKTNTVVKNIVNTMNELRESMNDLEFYKKVGRQDLVDATSNKIEILIAKRDMLFEKKEKMIKNGQWL